MYLMVQPTCVHSRRGVRIKHFLKLLATERPLFCSLLAQPKTERSSLRLTVLRRYMIISVQEVCTHVVDLILRCKASVCTDCLLHLVISVLPSCSRFRKILNILLIFINRERKFPPRTFAPADICPHPPGRLPP